MGSKKTVNSVPVKRPSLIHFHFHRRKTGVTLSIKNVLKYLQEDFEVYVFGDLFEENKVSFSGLIRILKDKNIKIIHAHRNNEIIRALILRFFGLNFKLVATRHAESKPSALTLYLLKKVDKVISLSKSIQRSLPIGTSVIGHGVQADFFIPNSKSFIKNVKQTQIICVAGRIREKKGSYVILEAILPILKENPDCALVFVGKIDDNKFLPILDMKISELGLKDQLYVFPETNEIKSFFQAAQVVVIPSFSEGFSLVCLEAMSCKSTVVATQGVGIHSEVIKDGVNGYLFPPGDVENLREILDGLIQKKLSINKDAARSEILKNWTAKKEASELKKIYLEGNSI